MKIEMAHRAYSGKANVLPEHKDLWLAKGWTEIVKPEKPTKRNVKKKEIEQ